MAIGKIALTAAAAPPAAASAARAEHPALRNRRGDDHGDHRCAKEHGLPSPCMK
jgi:hypothetical protein